MSQTHLLNLFDHFCQMDRKIDRCLLDGLCAALVTAIPNDSAIALAKRLPQLRVLRSLLPESSAVQALLSIAVSTSLPLFHDGRYYQDKAGRTISAVVSTSRERWRSSFAIHYEHADVSSAVTQAQWVAQNASLVSAMVYRTKLVRNPLLHSVLLGSDTSSLPIEIIVTILQALVDTDSFSEMMSDLDLAAIVSIYERVISALEDDASPAGTRRICKYALLSFARLPALLQEHIFPALLKVHRTSRRSGSPLHLMPLLTVVQPSSGATQHVIELLGDGLKTVITALSTEGGLTEETYSLLRLVGTAVKHHRINDIQYSETAIMTAIQHRLQDAVVLDLVGVLLESGHFKVR